MARLSWLLPVLLVTACGASGNFSRDTSAGCMTLQGGHTSPSVDKIALSADAGAFRARVGVDTAIVAFGRTSEEANRIEAAYARVLRAADKPTKYMLFQNRNAVVVWSEVPGDDAREVVLDCLVSR